MATKKSKKNKSSKSDAMRRMREGAPAAGEETEPRETKAQKRKRESAEKKEALKEAKRIEKEAIKLQHEANKLAKKTEREQKAAARKVEKEAKRKPKTGALTIEQVVSLGDSAIVQTLPELNEEQRISLADKGDAEIRKLEGRFISAAIIIRQFMVYELWKLAQNPETGNRGFKSIEKWAASAMPMSRSERFKAIKVAENLVPHIPEEDLKKMSSRNLQLLVSVPKAKLADPEIISAAKGSETKLRKTVNKKAPESGIEESEHILVPKSIRASFNEAIEAITALHELGDRYEAMEGLAIYFMQGQTEHPDFAGMSNRDAYNALKDREEDGDPNPEEQELHVNGEKTA